MIPRQYFDGTSKRERASESFDFRLSSGERERRKDSTRNQMKWLQFCSERNSERETKELSV